MRSISRIGLAFFCWTCILATGAAVAEPPPTDTIQTDYMRLPLHFEANLGQYPAGVMYASHLPSGDVWLMPGQAVLTAKRSAGGDALRVRLDGGRTDAMPEALNRLSGRANYIRGGSPRHWLTDIALYARVRFREVYPGIDMIYHGAGGDLEYDFVVRPGGDPERIALVVEGVDAVDRTRDASLMLRFGDDSVEFQAPIAYLEDEGERRPIPSSFTIDQQGRIGFIIGAYDREKTLVIDPVVRLSSCLGIENAETRGVGVDRDGNMYVAGFTSSTSLGLSGAHYDDTANGETDLFVVKMDPTGKSILYSTFIGGADKESCKAMAVAPDGCAYLTGNTKSPDFPVTSGGINHPHATYDVFVTKLNPTGSDLAYSCRFGGSAMEEARGIAVDADGNCIVVGGTHSPEWPTTSGSIQPVYLDPPEATPEVAGSFVNGEDAFIAKINPTGTGFVFSTLLGGHGFEKAWAVTTDDTGNIYVSGHVEATDFPVTNGAFQSTHAGGSPRAKDQYGPKDAFVAKLSADGSRVLAATYFGGAGQDVGYGVGLDAEGNVYLAGNTDSPNLPVKKASFAKYGGGKSDIFLASFTNDLSRLRYATYCGGTANEEIASDAFAVDSKGYAYAGGVTSSPDFPTSQEAFVKNFAGGDSDAFLLCLEHDGKLNYSTLLGGSKSDKCGDIAVDGRGSVYMAGSTSSDDFKVIDGAIAKPSGKNDVFLVRIDQK